MAQSFSNNALCLEAGSGTGEVVTRLAHIPTSSFVVGIDFSSEACNSAKVTTKNVKNKVDIVRGDIRQLPFRDNVFDFVTSLGVIEHFREPQQLLVEMKRVLKKGGRLFIETPNRKMYNLTSSRMKQHIMRYGHHDYYDPKELARLVKGSGLAIVNSYAYDFSWGVFTWFAPFFQTLSRGWTPPRTLLSFFIRVLTLPLNNIFGNRGYFSVVIANKK